MAIYKAIFSIIYVQQYLWLPFVSTGSFYLHYSGDDCTGSCYCHANAISAFLAFLTQFSLIASQLCFLTISVDLRNAYTNPFSTFKQNRMKYAIFIISFSLLTSICLMCMGNRVYGISTEGTVWIQDRFWNRVVVDIFDGIK